MEDVCKQIIKQWTEWCSQSSAKRESDDGIHLTLIHPHTTIMSDLVAGSSAHFNLKKH